MQYTIRKTAEIPELKGDWDGQVWSHAEPLGISHFYPQSSDHRPVTHVKLLYDDDTIYVHFRVEDRYVRCVHQEFQDMVCEDSCVEWFVQPRSDAGYVNIEMNCGGTLHCSYIEDPTRTPGGFKRFSYIPKSLAETIQIYHSLSGPILSELTESTEWSTEYAVPISLFEETIGGIGGGGLSGQTWRANFYKCGDKTSHPHWGSWAPLQELNFHRPEDFGEIVFE